ncbi:hypothetical protein [Dokdonia sp.]|uniref:hypothetical protein n=1 Tax=Dokdonia sp. TaxID=2024995 RepID=UPI0032652719
MKHKKRTQKPQGAFHKNLEQMTYNRIMNMTILKSDRKIRFLHDNRDKNNKTNMYVVFDGRTNQTHYATTYQQAEKRYNYLVANS